MLNDLIPEHRRTISLRGEMGLGKTRLAAILAKNIAVKENMPIATYMREEKKETTLPFYEQFCNGGQTKFEPRYHMTWNSLRNRNRIIVVEDAPAFMRTEQKKEMVQNLVTVLSRQNNLFSIITTQMIKSLPTRLQIELQRLQGDKFLYRVIEANNATSWVNWTDTENIDPILDAVYNGVQGKQLTRKGKAINKDSFVQKCFALFDSGKSCKDIIKELGFESQSIGYAKVYIYWGRWKKAHAQVVSS